MTSLCSESKPMSSREMSLTTTASSPLSASLPRSGSTRSSSTTSRARTSALTWNQRGNDPHRRTAAPTGAISVGRARQGPDRRGDPRRRREAARRSVKWPLMESVYDLYQRGCELLEHGDYQAAIVPLEQSPRPRARQGLDPRGARPRAVPRAALRGRRRGVRGGRRRARRPTTTRCSASGARCSCWGATARPASRSRWPARCAPSARTTGVYRDRARARRRAGLRRARGRSRRRCYARPTAFVPARRRRQQYREWAPARFFCVRRSKSMTPIQSDIEDAARATASPTSRCCSPRSSAAAGCASSSTIPTASRSRCASASRCS